MNTISPSPPSFLNSADCHATLQRLVGNLNGFAYRRRLDRDWTMEFVSRGCRDITGYDPHRLVNNTNIVYSDLIARSDLKRITDCVHTAARRRQRATIEYSIRTASGIWLRVEDRFTPVANAAGEIDALEGIIDRVPSRSHADPVLPHLRETRVLDASLAAP
jgi:PAS domain-containing protein